MDLNVEEIRKDFPVLHQKFYGKPFIYFDNAATTQKPKAVIDSISSLYRETNSNIHRGVHFLSEKATEMYEDARETVRQFINARHKREIIFTKGTTDSLNMLAFSFGERYISENDEIIISEMEHHSNIVPWQMMCERKRAKLKVIPFDDNGELEIDKLDSLITVKTKLIGITWVSNTLGTVNPVEKIIEKAHAAGIPVAIDAAQSVQHIPVDIQTLDCDFMAFSAHKVYASTGSGILYGKEKYMDEMPPYQGGGEMIKEVTFEKTTYNKLPLKFEAGTPDYAGAISLGKSIEYLNETGFNRIVAYESELLDYATRKLESIEGLTIYGKAKKRASLVSFMLQDVHPSDAGMVLDKLGIAVRTGTLCAEPVMKHFDITGIIRASFAFYNTKKEIDRLYDGLLRVKTMF